VGVVHSPGQLLRAENINDDGDGHLQSGDYRKRPEAGRGVGGVHRTYDWASQAESNKKQQQQPEAAG
jgi:hypothetical protein